ncbi:MAG TPA: molybdopterin-dependent oxidoreductase [Thermoplasmata archaeon]|nr:molybdopterin-dependent oxidoreductase [Thermoplasmata archaeon]
MSVKDSDEAPVNTQEAPARGPKPGKIAATGMKKIVALIVIAALLVAIPMGYMVLQENDSGDEADDDPVMTVNGDGESIELSIAQLEEMSTCSGSGYLMKSTGTIVGPHEYTGVPLRDIVDLVYENDNYSLTVVAHDGYEMTYNSGQVENGTFPTYDLEGTLLGPEDLTLMLAFIEDGENMPVDDLRIVIVDDTETPVTDGHFWAKMVSSINVGQYVEDWTLHLSGVEEMDMDRQTFESLASCYYHTTYYNYTKDEVDYSFEGVPLWVLISAIDGGDVEDGHYAFNDALAEIGYFVNVTASDGYSANFTSEQVARNDSIIVAYKLNGEVLEEGDWPLRIVGEDLSGTQKVKMVASIALEEFEDEPAWEMELIGLTSTALTEWDFVSLYNCEDGAHISYYNYTVDLVEHSYAGIPLWVLIGMVDGADTDHWMFNDTLADLGYNVNVSAEGGYYTIFAIEDIMYNDSLIIALTFDGEYLTGDYYPLTLTGEDLPSSMKVKGVVKIELVDIPE